MQHSATTLWEILGLEPTNDRKQIKRAYAKKLRQCHPEDDPEGFARLRQAYEDALEYLDLVESHEAQSNEPPSDEVEPAAEATPSPQPVADDAWSEPGPEAQPELSPLVLRSLQQLQDDSAWLEGIYTIEAEINQAETTPGLRQEIYRAVMADSLADKHSEKVTAFIAWRWFYDNLQLNLPFNAPGDQIEAYAKRLGQAMHAPLGDLIKKLNACSEVGDEAGILHHIQATLALENYDQLEARRGLRQILRNYFTEDMHLYSHALLAKLDHLLLWDDLPHQSPQEDWLTRHHFYQRLSMAESELAESDPPKEGFTKPDDSISFLKQFILVILGMVFLLGTYQCPGEKEPPPPTSPDLAATMRSIDQPEPPSLP